MHIGETVPLKSPDEEDTPGGWGSDGMYQPAANNSGLWSLSSPMSRACAEQLEEALLAWRGASLARPVFGAAMRWSPSGVAFWAYPRAWATAEVRVGAGVGESQV